MAFPVEKWSHGIKKSVGGKGRRAREGVESSLSYLYQVEIFTNYSTFLGRIIFSQPNESLLQRCMHLFWQFLNECVEPIQGYEDVFSNMELLKKKLDNSLFL